MLAPHLPLLCVFVLGCGVIHSSVRFWRGTDSDPERPGNAHIALHCPYYVDRNLLAITRRRLRSSNSTPTKCCPALGSEVGPNLPALCTSKTGGLIASNRSHKICTPRIALLQWSRRLLDAQGRLRRTLGPSAHERKSRDACNRHSSSTQCAMISDRTPSAATALVISDRPEPGPEP